MKKIVLLALCAAGAAGALALLPLSAAEMDAYIYTYEGRPNLFRRGKVLEMGFDMPIKDGDRFKAEADNSLDFIFFRAVGVRFTGPGELYAQSVSSLTGLELTVTGGTVLLHIESPDEEPVDFALETPGALVRARGETLAYIHVLPLDKDGKRATTEVLVKKGRLEVTTALSGATVHVLEFSRIKIDPDTYIPAAQGASIEELKPAEAARGVYIPQEEKSDF